jgi:hypothetical protein
MNVNFLWSLWKLLGFSPILTKFECIHQMLVKIHTVAAELPHSDRHDEDNVFSQYFTNASKTEFDMWDCRSFIFYSFYFKHISLRFTPSMYAETHLGLLLNWLLKVLYLDALRKGWITCKISLFSSCYTHIERRTGIYFIRRASEMLT